MKFYLAARFSRIEEIERNAQRLRDAGYITTSRWHTPGHQPGPSRDEAEFRRRGTEDLEDVRAADAIIVHTGDVDPATGAATRGGYHTEVGIALGIGKQIALVGERLNVFHYIPGIIRYATFDEVFDSITGGRWPVHFEIYSQGETVKIAPPIEYPDITA